MAVRRTTTQIASLAAVAAVLGIGLAAIALGDRADAAPPFTPAPATAEVRFNPNQEYDQVRYKAAGGQHNTLAITLRRSGDGSAFTYTLDDSVEIRPGRNCTHPDETDLTLVTCSTGKPGPKDEQGGGPSLSAHLYDQDDTVTFANRAAARIPSQIDLGAGADTFTTVSTRYDGSQVWGNSGDDRISTGAGSSVQAGTGNDTVSVAGNGSYASGDEGDDEITGGLGAQVLTGAEGDDVLRGGRGPDRLLGGTGNDRLLGGPGADTLDGGSGNNQLK